jgi:sigma-B regulation protein RsbU (phosphoserine phosphatase)
MKTGRCHLANAGLPPPYHVRNGGGDVETVFGDGFILGVFDDDLYPGADEVAIQLDRGDTLLLYTDGLSEVENESGEQFDAARFREVLLQNTGSAGRELFETLVDSSRDFGKTTHKWDDITILGIERR